MNNNDSKNTRQKIIQAAIDEFAEKGFNGGRVGNIAKRAGVSQALIYYNFKSKEALLDEIIEELLESIVSQLSTHYHPDTDSSKTGRFTLSDFEAGLDFSLTKRKQYSILMMQALKNDKTKARIFTIWNEVNQRVRSSILSAHGFKKAPSKDLNQQVVDYFFIFIPYVAYIIMGSNWSRENRLSMKETNKAMSKVIGDLFKLYWKP